MHGKNLDLKMSAWLFTILVVLVAVPQPGFAQTYTTLYSFSGPDGANPYYGTLAIDTNGNLYGTTYYGGAFNDGTVYEVTPSGAEKLLYSFAGSADGNTPMGGLLIANGALYGTTNAGGMISECGGAGCGTLFKITGVGKKTILHTFAGPTSDGAWPYNGLLRDSANNLYGTTTEGGSGNRGSLFVLTNSGNELVFSFRRGALPQGALFRDSSGHIYGTTNLGGPNVCSGLTCGTVFEMSPSGESTIYAFGASSVDGKSPLGGLISDLSGNLYGTTYSGGRYNFGTVFKLSKSTGTWIETILYDFSGGADGAYPESSLLLDSSGNLYGTTWGGGSAGAGTVFSVSSAGQETALYSFSGGADGAHPVAGLVSDTLGNLYGTTSGGGNPACAGGCGVVFKVTP